MLSRARRTQKSFSLRKRPSQERARATVDAILQAATYILAKRGWKALTTNGIAERAGVNIASLYQYFPNKEAIVAELRRRWLEQLNSCEAGAAPPKTLAATLDTSIDLMIRQRLVNPELHRVFEDELPKSTGVFDAGPARDRGNFDPAMLRGVPDVELAGFIARSAATAVIDAAARERPALLRSPLFKAELAALLTGYLRR